MARRVVAPGGVRWKVGRQWLSPTRQPQRDRWTDDGIPPERRPFEQEVPALWWYDPSAARPMVLWNLVLLAPIVALVVAVPFLIVYFALGPVALAAVIALLVALVVLVMRRRTWTVRADVQGHRHGHLWRVRGWRASGAVVEIVADALQTGGPLPHRAITYGEPPDPLPRLSFPED